MHRDFVTGQVQVGQRCHGRCVRKVHGGGIALLAFAVAGAALAAATFGALTTLTTFATFTAGALRTLIVFEPGGAFATAGAMLIADN